eukprot:540124-Amphidinium_carterae.1
MYVGTVFDTNILPLLPVPSEKDSHGSKAKDTGQLATPSKAWHAQTWNVATKARGRASIKRCKGSGDTCNTSSTYS